jgi:DNA-binding response OmpR family regulator
VGGALRERAGVDRVLVRGRLRIDTAKAQAWVGSRALKLERRPLQTLQLLAGREGEVVARAELLESIWGSKYAGFEHSVEQAVYEVRRALREPGWIETIRGIGYRFITQP